MTTAPDIFLPYNREDQAVARRFAEAFEGRGIDVSWDAKLKSGEAYDEVAETADLSHCREDAADRARQALRKDVRRFVEKAPAALSFGAGPEPDPDPPVQRNGIGAEAQGEA